MLIAYELRERVNLEQAIFQESFTSHLCLTPFRHLQILGREVTPLARSDLVETEV